MREKELCRYYELLFRRGKWCRGLTPAEEDEYWELSPKFQAWSLRVREAGLWQE